jgi:hypothetical protein
VQQAGISFLVTQVMAYMPIGREFFFPHISCLREVVDETVKTNLRAMQ